MILQNFKSCEVRSAISSITFVFFAIIFGPHTCINTLVLIINGTNSHTFWLITIIRANAIKQIYGYIYVDFVII